MERKQAISIQQLCQVKVDRNLPSDLEDACPSLGYISVNKVYHREWTFVGEVIFVASAGLFSKGDAWKNIGVGPTTASSLPVRRTATTPKTSV